MCDKYIEMLQHVKMRKAFINMSSLEDDRLNAEWLELKSIENSLYKLIKLMGQ